MTDGGNNFPKIGIVTADLVAEVERLLLEAASEAEGKTFHFGAVNWGDLGVVDVEYRKSMLHPDKPHCVVRVEEASPECDLAQWIGERLDKERFPNVYIECEW